MPSLGQKIQFLYPGAAPLLDFMVADDGSGAKIIAWNDAIGARPTQAQLDAVLQSDIYAAAVSSLRSAATAAVDAQDASGDRYRALLLVMMDEFNRHTTVEKAMFDAVAAATSLADLKTRYAAIAQLPQRVPADIKTGVTNKISSGAAD